MAKDASHLQDFAHHLIERHGPRTTGEIVHAFTNVGNHLAGPHSTPEEKAFIVRDELSADARLAFNEEGGVWQFSSDAEASEA